MKHSRSFVVVLSVAGILIAGFTVFRLYFVGDCLLSSGTDVWSPDRLHYGRMDHPICRVQGKDKFSVLVGPTAEGGAMLMLDVRGGSAPKLEWRDNSELSVTVSTAAQTATRGPYSELPRVSVVRANNF